MYINTNPLVGKLETLPKMENYISLEVQQKTEFLIKIWNAIGYSPMDNPASLNQHAKDEVLANLIKLIKEVFPRQENKSKEVIPMKTLKPLPPQDKEFITYLEELVRVAEAQKERNIDIASSNQEVHEGSAYGGMMNYRGKDY